MDAVFIYRIPRWRDSVKVNLGPSDVVHMSGTLFYCNALAIEITEDMDVKMKFKNFNAQLY